MGSLQIEVCNHCGCRAEVIPWKGGFVCSSHLSPREIDEEFCRQHDELAKYKDLDENWVVCSGCDSYVRDLPHDDGELSFCDNCHQIDKAEADNAKLRERIEWQRVRDVNLVNQIAKLTAAALAKGGG